LGYGGGGMVEDTTAAVAHLRDEPCAEISMSMCVFIINIGGLK
jgi:hypothetical protein